MEDVAFDELETGELLARVGRNRAAARGAEVENFAIAAHWAQIHNPDSRPPGDGSALSGRERTRHFGGPGTPAMWEFAVAELAVELEISTACAKYLIRDALNTLHRLPRIWGRVQAGQVRVSYARYVSAQTQHLSMEAALRVDAEVAESADGRVSWARFQDLVAGKIVAADPATAARREAEAAGQQFARATRATEHAMKGGCQMFCVNGWSDS